MELNRPALKQQAKGLLMVCRPGPLAAGAVYMALSAVTSFLQARLVGVSYETLDRTMRFYAEGDLDRALAVWTAAQPAPSAGLINLALELVMMIVSVGFTLFILNTVRGTGPVLGNLLDGFGMIGRILLLNLLVGLFVLLWSFLLIVPGIIALYRYSMATYFLLDHPEYSVMECIRESKRITTGYKKELFLLDLSFLGWIILTALPYIGYLVSVWVTPYIAITRALYYERLSGHVRDTAYGQGPSM